MLLDTKDTDNPPDVDSSAKSISVLGELTDSFDDHRRQVALADHSHRRCEKKTAATNDLHTSKVQTYDRI